MVYIAVWSGCRRLWRRHTSRAGNPSIAIGASTSRASAATPDQRVRSYHPSTGSAYAIRIVNCFVKSKQALLVICWPNGSHLLCRSPRCLLLPHPSRDGAKVRAKRMWLRPRRSWMCLLRQCSGDEVEVLSRNGGRASEGTVAEAAMGHSR